MWNIPTIERLDKIPKLYETENTSTKDKEIHLHFFIAASDFYAAEFDGEDIFFGFVNHNDNMCAEWGYFSLSELKSIKIDGWLEVDCELPEHFPVTKAIDIEKIRKAQGWGKEKPLYSKEELMALAKVAMFDSVIELKCPVCMSTIRCEPDAQRSFCHACNQVVNTKNPLIALGLI